MHSRREGGRASCMARSHVLFNFVSEGGYVGEMDNVVVFCIGDGKGECAVSFFHGQDWDHDVICPCIHLLIVRMVPFVVEDGLA